MSKEALAQPDQEYQFGVYSAEDLDKAWKSGYDNCKAQSLWTLEDVKKAWKRGYAAAKKEQRQARVGIYTTPPQRTWVGLTEDERTAIREGVAAYHDTTGWSYAKAVQQATELKLQEKNA